MLTSVLLDHLCLGATPTHTAPVSQHAKGLGKIPDSPPDQGNLINTTSLHAEEKTLSVN